MHFIGEDGIDAGGVKKEFFQLLITELLCPDYGMLVFQSVRVVLVDALEGNGLKGLPASAWSSFNRKKREIVTAFHPVCALSCTCCESLY